jgi:hypothetical protein
MTGISTNELSAIFFTNKHLHFKKIKRILQLFNQREVFIYVICSYGDCSAILICSKENKEALSKLLDFPILPKKGRLSKKDIGLEHSKEFIKYRKKHSAVESAINALEVHGLDKCLDKGFYGFKRYIALAVVSRNIQKLGARLKIKAIKHLKKYKIAI